MRDLLILSGMGILSVAVWTIPVDANPPSHGSMHGQIGHVGPVRHGGGHAVNLGLLFPIILESRSRSLPGEPEPAPPPSMPAVNPGVGGLAHSAAEHVGFQTIHPPIHVSVRTEPGEATTPQATGPGGAGSDQVGAAMAQPNPTANPWSPRPPGVVGPGRLSSGRPGPGLPGPGQPASPRW